MLVRGSMTNLRLVGREGKTCTSLYADAWFKTTLYASGDQSLIIFGDGDGCIMHARSEQGFGVM